MLLVQWMEEAGAGIQSLDTGTVDGGGRGGDTITCYWYSGMEEVGAGIQSLATGTVDGGGGGGDTIT